jgi:primosomal protein N' (replication factor Y)
MPEVCPACAAAGNFAAIGPGVERIAEEVAEVFPEARVLVMASDVITGPKQAAEAARKILEREVDIVIGTQMVAKGWHFPGLTLVGVVDADLGLNGGDLRASERTYQLLHQVAGRAGRAERAGRVLLQSYMPEHRVMQALVDGRRDAFLAVEADERKTAGMPPFGRLAALIVSGADMAEVGRVARLLARAAPRGDGVTVLGPAPAPLAMLRGLHRERLLLKARRDVPVQRLIAEWLTQVNASANVRIQVDIDPYSFL